MEKIDGKDTGRARASYHVTGGPIKPGRSPNLAACEVGEPHDFVDQESETAAGIVRFIRGGSY